MNPFTYQFFLSAIQSCNEEMLMYFIDEAVGILKEVRLVQPSNAQRPILMTESGIEMLFLFVFKISANAVVHHSLHTLTGVKVFVKCAEDFNDIARSEMQLHHILL